MQALSATEAPTTLSFAERLERFRYSIDHDLARLLERKRREVEASAPQARELVAVLAELVASGGKRLRPALVHHAYLACGGSAPEEARPLALATELLHTYLLIHDDIMDHAEMRRGRPTAHARFREQHRAHGWRGDAGDFGRSIAILVGDLAASYAFELASGVGLRDEGLAGLDSAERRAAVERCFAAMAQEVIHGQYLEILAGVAQAPSEDDLLQVLRLKSGRYSVERPIELGALAAGASGGQLAALARYGHAVGEAFQLQDDLLGMFGDAAKVGKPVGADLAEGKFTFLIYHALQDASPADRAWLEAARGDAALSEPDRQRALALLASTGAVARVHAMVAERLEVAREALAHASLAASLPVAEEGRVFLEGLIEFSRERQR